MSESIARKWAALLILCGLPLVGSTGCAVLYQLAYGDGPKIEAQYDGLQGQRVAVVCMMDPSAYGDGTTSTFIAGAVERILKQQVRNVDIVDQNEVADWLDTNQWDETDFVEIGKGVKADMVLAIDVASFRVHKSQTLLQGNSELRIRVLDMRREGRAVFTVPSQEYIFPKSHAVPAITTDGRAFQRAYIEILAEQIAKNFYDYDMAEDFARDGAAYAH